MEASLIPKTLYLLTTKGLGDYYVLSTDPTNAALSLSTELSKAHYGYLDDQTVTNIKVIAHELTKFPGDKINFSSGKKLLLNGIV